MNDIQRSASRSDGVWPIPPAALSAPSLQYDQQVFLGGAQACRQDLGSRRPGPDGVGGEQRASRAKGQCHRHHEASIRHCKNRSADGCVQCGCLDVGKPGVVTAEHICDLVGANRMRTARRCLHHWLRHDGSTCGGVRAGAKQSIVALPTLPVTLQHRERTS